MIRVRPPLVLPSVLCLLLSFACNAQPVAVESLNLVPWPAGVQAGKGAFAIGPAARIVAADKDLAPLAKVLAGEIAQVAGPSLACAEDSARAGDIQLRTDSALAKDEHKLEIGEVAIVRGGSFQAVAEGTATLLQLIRRDGDRVLVPRLTVADRPAAPFRGLLVDVARQYHTIDSLKQMVVLCRLYKIRYLQLHLTDDQGFMFPVRAYPKLGAQNWNKGKTYSLEQLKDLVAFADARGVTVIPEYEVPGHSGAANRAMGDLFKIKGTKPYEHHASINFAREDVMKAVETIVGEMCEVFRSTPYFHIGGDEADLALADQNADFKAAEARLGLPNAHELYRRFLVRMNEIVKKQGKQMIVWEGFGRRGKVAIPKDIIVMAYEIRFYRPDHLLQDGYRVVNASWTPLYVVNKKVRPPSEIYAWDVHQFKPHAAKPDDKGIVVPPSRNLLGAQMCAWEQRQEIELPSLRGRLPAMAERVWNPSAGKTCDDFERRFAATDKLLDALLPKTDQ